MRSFSDEFRKVLEGRHYATLATHNDDGTIHMTPVWYLFESGKFYVGSLSTSRKVRNLIAQGEATIMIDTRKPGSELWVSASGSVDIISGEASRQINARIFPRYLTKDALEDSQIGPTFAAADDVTICLTPKQWRSWSSKDVDQQYFGGKLTSTPEKWFRPMDE
jgi:PPOX class probable F420-dependent enzyme